MIEGAKEKIVVLQPYYVPIRRVERGLEEAMARGVKVEIITARRRD